MTRVLQRHDIYRSWNTAWYWREFVVKDHNLVGLFGSHVQRILGQRFLRNPLLLGLLGTRSWLYLPGPTLQLKTCKKPRTAVA